MGDKTVAVDAFEGNNLVLVDEGHRGASGGGDGAWMRFRNALCERGFSFEYSATFGQAVKGNPALTEVYARNTLYDYSYRHFYRDGFGKDYQILNLDEQTQSRHLELYLVASLLSFFQQQRLYRERESAFRPFQLEKPLWIFVGGSVTATLATQDGPDIVQILQFLAGYVKDRQGSVQRIERVLNQGILTATGSNLFAGRFAYLKAIRFGQHLYQPLLHLESSVVEISPAPLNRGEWQFVKDLKAFHEGHADYFKGRELYLLRNLSRGRGVGFFEAGGFHPDFILWLLAGDEQHVVFVDPKGIRNLGPTDLKLQFHETIKDIEARLADPRVHLQSFIVSNTPSATMRMLWNMEKSEMQKRHILFQEEDKDSYVKSMLDLVIA